MHFIPGQRAGWLWPLGFHEPSPVELNQPPPAQLPLRPHKAQLWVAGRRQQVAEPQLIKVAGWLQAIPEDKPTLRGEPSTFSGTFSDPFLNRNLSHNRIMHLRRAGSHCRG